MHITDSLQSIAGAALLLSGTIISIQARGLGGLSEIHQHHAHSHHRRHRHVELEPEAIFNLESNDTSSSIEKRGGQCAFPYADGMVAVDPAGANAGWAMSPDQPCLPGHYCPYACAPGLLSAQWNPAATSYSYPLSMDGGLFCNPDGSISKPFPNKPYCYPGKGTFGARNAMGANVAICQTVLPGNEAMLIATNVNAGAVTGLAVPGLEYWAGTAAHYYINPAGVSTEQGCVWGDSSKPWGNWAPYVAGANMDGNGNTFVKVGWNPIYTDDGHWNQILPTWAVMIECTGGGCNGTPCRCDPADGMNVCSGGSQGAGGAAFCVVTIPPGSSANVVVYDSASGPGAKVQLKAIQPTSSTPSSIPSLPSSTTFSKPSSTSSSTSSTSSSTKSTSTSSSSSSSVYTPPPVTSTSTSVLFVVPSTSASASLRPLLLTQNTTTASPTSFSLAPIPSMHLNFTTPIVIATPTLLRGGAGYDNLLAASPSASTKSSGTILRASPGLLFLTAVLILTRL